MHTETFSYLPPMTEDEIRKQVEYIIEKGYIPGIEYTFELHPKISYWHFWKLPFFIDRNADKVMEELAACKAKNPNAWIKVTGYDNKKQCQVLSFVVYRPEEAAQPA